MLNKNKVRIINLLLYSVLVILILFFIFLLLKFETSPYCFPLSQEKALKTEEPTISSIQEFKDIVEEVAQENAGVLLPVFGDSMFPAIEGNSSCGCVKEKNYYVDDIIVFYVVNKTSTTFVSHRIIKIKTSEGKLYYLTQGDNNEFDDGIWLEYENIFCKIVEQSYLDRILEKIKT